MDTSRPARHDGGFTLLELLVVMIILGVLAALAVPAFLQQKEKAYEAAAKADVQAIARAVADFYVGGNGPLTVSAGTDPLDWQLADSASNVVATGHLSAGNSLGATSTIASDASYCVAIVPSRGAQTWKATEDGLASGPCP